MTISEASVTAVGAELGPYPETPVGEVPAIVERAFAAFADPRLADHERRAAALGGGAELPRASGEELRKRCEAESGLPSARVAGELERTCVQLELFADVISAGEHLEAIIDPADADARPWALVQELTSVLAARVGRVVFDAYPTGVAVSWAMQHGGPYPATTFQDHTSVGLTSTRRFMRPVCWQNAPAVALPAPLRDENPSGIWRRIDGVLTTASVAAAGKERG